MKDGEKFYPARARGKAGDTNSMAYVKSSGGGELTVLSVEIAEDIPGFLDSWERTTATSDVYYRSQYLKAEAKHQDGHVLFVRYDHKQGCAIRPVVMRPIHSEAPEIRDKVLYDLVTPYEYGGPLVLPIKSKISDWLVDESQAAFEIFCREFNIVCEFARFHPLIGNHSIWGRHFDIRELAANITIELQSRQGEPHQLMSRGQRRNIVKNERLGITAGRVANNQKNMSKFRDIYLRSMKRLGAAPFYHFNDEYFQALGHLPDAIISLYMSQGSDSNPISALVVLHGDTYAHSHLLGAGANAPDGYSHAMIYHQAALDLQGRGFQTFHLGGAGAVQPGVRGFKERLSPMRVPYMVGSVIYDEPIYLALMNEFQDLRSDRGPAFFPAYRSKGE